jgi:abhydrolase domain-containing protein 17
MNWKYLRRQVLIRLIRFPLLLYAALLLYGWLGSEYSIFIPPSATYRDGARIIKLATDDGVRISAMHFTNASAHFTILFSHGNAEDLGTVQYDLEGLCKTGFNTFGYDYHGYGTSEGRPTERNAYRDIDAAYRYLTETLKIAPSNIIVFGHSVGSGPTVDLASRKPVGGLIIQSGFVSAFRVMTHWKILPFDRFDNLSKLPKVKCPVLIMHGTADTIIPSWHGEELFKAANEPKKLMLVTGANHNDFNEVAGQRYFKTIREFVGTIFMKSNSSRLPI